jgi:Fe-S oxidoreductase
MMSFPQFLGKHMDTLSFQNKISKTVTLHEACKSAFTGLDLTGARDVLQKLPGVDLVEMPRHGKKTVCCGSGAGLNAGENMELRMTGGLPRANAVKYVHEKHGVNMLSCICAIDRAALPPLMEYWVPEVDVTGLHEMVANALIMPGENERSTDLRGEDIPGREVVEKAEEEKEGESEEQADE